MDSAALLLAQAGASNYPITQMMFWIAPAAGVVSLVFAWLFYSEMKKADPGNPTMVKIAGYVKKGAMAYLWQQYRVVGKVFVVLVFLLGIMAWMGLQNWIVPFAFLTGGFFSGLCGYLGMQSATEASSRTAWGARESLNRGLQIAFRSGGVMGLTVVGLALLDITVWFYVLYYMVPSFNLQDTTITMLAFGMGASTQALFARVGGGIYTKAADVGADLVGKVEAGIPEDDPRNPATIADNVGDNVGDVAGMGADLYESYAGSILATAALGYAAAHSYGGGGDDALPWVVLPMVIAGIGNLFSIAGMYAVRTGEDTSLKMLMAALFRGINLATVLTAVASLFVAMALFKEFKFPDGTPTTMGLPAPVFGVWIAIVAGLASGWVIGKATEYYTSNDFKPTQSLADQAVYGPATVIIDGVAVGMIATAIPVLAVVVGILVSYGFMGGFVDPIRGLYGVSIAAVGMLATLGITLATDAYGPIADNAGGNAQMSGLEPHVRERTDALDSLGNTTAATGKGFAIGSAALTALALLASYIEEVRNGLRHIGEKTIQVGGETVVVMEATIAQFLEYYDVTLMNPKVLLGIFLGSMMVFVFCALTLKAVGRAAGAMVAEVKRQFKEIAGIMEGKAEPDYARCVEISTAGAQREMIFPSVLALITPILTGLVLGVGGVMGLLAGTLSTGFVMAIMMAASGGAWDNAKKWVEKGHHGGKGSFAHKAAVIGDTVGDPFKDTSGPSLNILIKLMTMVSIVFVGFVLKFGGILSAALGMGR